MNRLNRFLDVMADLFQVIATLCLALMLIINAVNIVWRAATNHAFDWVFPWTMLIFVWMLFIGLYVYMRTRRDVVVDIIVARFPGPLRIGIAVLGDVIALVVMILILWASPKIISLQLSSMDAIDLPRYVRSLPLFISAALLVLHFGSHAVMVLTGQAAAFPLKQAGASHEEGAPE